MAELKTKKTTASVAQFLNGIKDEGQCKDSKELAKLMGAITGEKPKMWGDSIVGSGTYPYQTRTGAPLEWFKVGFAPRSRTLTLYIMDGFSEYSTLLSKLGKHSTGKSCLYVKRLDDIDRKVLEQLITKSVAAVGRRIGEAS
ncbi:MAG TPA: DUF1801 domain-containing protein [Acidimicrobiia bacterium]|nr:DUF1801 domain-containing protein [Acidimicrobiia bacterium]